MQAAAQGHEFVSKAQVWRLAELGGLGDNRAFVDAARAYVQAFDLAGLRSFLTSFETGREPIHG